MVDLNGKPRIGWISGFSRIAGVAEAQAMARKGGIAGALLTLSEAIGVALLYSGIDATTFKRVPETDFDPMEFYIGAAVSGIFLIILAMMSWRMYVGKGYVSPVLLLLLLAYEGYSKAFGGTLAVGWMFVYALLGINLIGATRGAWYLGRTAKASKQVSHF